MEKKTGQRIAKCKKCDRRMVWSSRLAKWLHVARQDLAGMHPASV